MYSARVLLLGDIRAIFAARGADKLASVDIVAELIAIEGRPWAEWKAGKPITANGLARLLAPFNIVPSTIRIGDATPKGYQLAQFGDVFVRYLPAEAKEPPQRHNADGTGISCTFTTATRGSNVAV